MPANLSWSWRRSLCSLFWVSGVLALASGCGSGPRAPALIDESVYQNKGAGFRFVVPEGWSQHARSELPPGPLDKERLLVQFKRLTSADRGATMEVTAMDVPESDDLAPYVAGPDYGVKKWTPAGTPEKLEPGGVAATRYVFANQVGAEKMVREVTAFRRGGRVYLFKGIFGAADKKARDQIRQAVASTVWKS